MTGGRRAKLLRRETKMNGTGKGKKIIITGASRGIGKATALKLAIQA